MEAPSTIPTKATALDWFFRILGFVALSLIAFSLPAFPEAELDASWRMALGQFFTEGRQFGTEVVFTYGPLGYVMGKTYWGGLWESMIAWHLVLSLIFAAVVYWHAFRLQGQSRLWFLLFFFIFGLSYQDAMHQIIIALVGLELIRRSDQPWRWGSVALVTLLAVLSLVKFTNIVLSLFLVLLAGGLELWTRRSATALRIPGLYAAGFLAGWMACGQQLGNLPAYFRSSWEISQGYQDAMGFSCPPLQLRLGLTVLLLIVTVTLLDFVTAINRVRQAVLTLGVGAFIYLHWKHGYIRADGHQIGFYYAALTVVVTSPIMLEQTARWLMPKRALLIAAGLLSLVGMEQVLPGIVRGCLGSAQHELNRNISFFVGGAYTRESYEDRLRTERFGLDLIKTRNQVGQSSIDVLGFEQAAAIFNRFNYQPRPVFQGYSAYTPYLSRLNYDYYASDEAPEYVLFKLQTIDGRLQTMDDPHALWILIQRYTYLFSELGFTLWQRKPGPFDAAAYEPAPIRTATFRVGEAYDVSDLMDQNLWVELDYRLNLLGKLRRFFFKPPLVQLRITDNQGVESIHRLPQPIGRAGFMLNPVISDMLDFMRAAGGTPKRRVRTITVEPAVPQDRDCLRDEVRVTLAAMPPSQAGVNFFREADSALFYMFVDAPTSHTSYLPPNEDIIDKRRVMILHAPSEMIFDVPSGAGELNGYYGFVPGAYSDGGKTNGAEFVVIWTDGVESLVLHERFLDPVTKLNDRGLQKFHVKLPRSSGRVLLRVNPGPHNQFAFDWTGWSAIEFK